MKGEDNANKEGESSLQCHSIRCKTRARLMKLPASSPKSGAHKIQAGYTQEGGEIIEAKATSQWLHSSHKLLSNKEIQAY